MEQHVAAGEGDLGESGLSARSNDPLEAVRATVRRLVWPDGCAWHAVQTHESLLPYLIEESAEVVDAVDRGLPATELAAELGDLLYQVLFHSAIAERDGEGFDLDAVAATLDAKLIARHPHVFGDRGYLTVDELNAEWERLKEDAAGERRGSRGVLDGIPVGMPTLARAAKVVDRLRRAELIDPALAVTNDDSLLEVAESTDELHLAETMIGDALLAQVTRANALGVDADRALRLATARLADRLT